MKKLLSFLLLFAFLQHATAQVVVTQPQKFLQYIIVGSYSTATRPAPVAATLIYNTDSSKYQYANGSNWVTIGGSGNTVYTNGYGIKISGANILFDSGAVRRMDTLYAITDSTYGFYINSTFYSFKARGALFSFNGRNGTIILNSSDVIAALGYTPANAATTITINGVTQDISTSRTWTISNSFVDSVKRKPGNDTVYYYKAGVAYFGFTDSIGGTSAVTSFNTRTGAITLTSTDVDNALGFVPLATTSNLSDVASPSAARTNLGLATVAHTGSYTDLINIPTTIVSTDSSYANPFWITSFAYSKITGAPFTPNNTAYNYLNGFGNLVQLNSDSIVTGTVNKFFLATDTAGFSLKLDSIRRTSGTDSVYGWHHGIKVFQFMDSSGINSAVTSVAAGLFMSFTTITSSGTVNADSAAMAAYFTRRKDSTIAFATPTQLTAGLAGKQAIITPSNTIKQYWNGYEQFVNLNTDSIPQGSTNKYFIAADTAGLFIAPANTANKYWNGYKQFVALNTDSITEGGTNKFFHASDTAGVSLKLDSIRRAPGSVAVTGYHGGIAVFQYNDSVGSGGVATIPPNIGSSYRIYSPQVPGFKTLQKGVWELIDSATSNTLTLGVDSAALGAYFLRKSDSALYATPTAIAKLDSQFLKGAGAPGIVTMYGNNTDTFYLKRLKAGLLINPQQNNDSGYQNNLDTAGVSAIYPRRADSLIAFATPTQLNLKQSALSGTGYIKQSGSSSSYVAQIPLSTDVTGLLPNANLLNSTISGVSLGGNLFTLSNGYGINTLSYNGSAVQSVIADTTKLIVWNDTTGSGTNKIVTLSYFNAHNSAGTGNSDTTFTISGNASFTMAIDDMISMILVTPSVTTTGFQIGTTSNGQDVISNRNFIAGSNNPIAINYWQTGATTLYIQNISGSTLFKIAKRHF